MTDTPPMEMPGPDEAAAVAAAVVADAPGASVWDPRPGP